MQPLLSAAMIVRDEERHLTECLQSICEVCDEIVIVDTGSVDATMEIARSFGAVVIEHAWRQDFSAARNIALERASGRWILYIDADERLRPISRELVRSTLAGSSDVSLRLRLRPRRDWTPYWEYRLWRSDPRIRFAGVMHEKITTSIGAVVRADRGTLAESPLFLEHVGYEGDQSHKHRRNAPLLRAQLEIQPANAHDWAHLATVLDGLGQAGESEAALERAVEVARELRPPSGGLAYHSLIQRRLAEGRDVSALLAEALASYPDNLALAWTQVRTQIDSGDYERALDGLERFSADTEMPVEEYISYPRTLFEIAPALARAVCLFKLERYAEAAAVYATVEALDPDDPGHRVRRILAEHRASAAGARASGGAGPLAGPGPDADPGPDARPRPEAAGERWSARELTSGIAVDIGGVAVGLRATDAARAQAIRALLGRMPLTSAEPRARLIFGSHRIHPPRREPDDHQGELRLWHDADGSSIEDGDDVGARTEAGLGRLGGQSTDLARLFRRVAPFMLADLLGPYGRYVTHGGAIQRDGEAVLIFGGSGAGKSTLVLGAMRAGWGVLSDDLIVIQSHASGPRVSGIPKTLAIPPEVLGDETADRTIPGDPRHRRELRFEAWDRGVHPVAAAVIVAHGNQPETVIEPVSSELLVSHLLRSMLSRRPAVLRDYMSTILSVCALPTGRLLHSSSPAARPERAVAALEGYLQAGRAGSAGQTTSRSVRIISRHSRTSSSGGSGSS